MSDEAMVHGTYADFKVVRSRGVMQMVVEVPIERWKPLVDAFGMPQPGAEIPVAVVRLMPGAKMITPTRKEVYQEKTPGEQAVTRAAILCNDKAFQTWVEANFGIGGDELENAVDYVRSFCGVPSRRDLATNQDALDRFHQIEDEFKEATGHATEAR